MKPQDEPSAKGTQLNLAPQDEPSAQGTHSHLTHEFGTSR